MYPYRNSYPSYDQRFIGLGWPLAIGGLSFLGGLIGGGLGASFGSRPFYGGYGYPVYGYPGAGYPGYPGYPPYPPYPPGYPGVGYKGYGAPSY